MTERPTALRSPDYYSLPLGLTERRVLWIISLYRGGYTLALLGSFLLSNLQQFQLHHSLAYAFCAMPYFFFAMVMIVMALLEEQLLSLNSQLWIALFGDTFFLAALMITGDPTLISLPIFIFPQLAAHGWLLERRLAWGHAAFPTLVFLTVSVFLYWQGTFDVRDIVVTALVCASYFFIVRIAMDIGHYTKASAKLAQQRGIDIINLEQINRTVIRDMKDGVMIIDLAGIVRGYNPQAPRLLDIADSAAAGQLLERWSEPLNDAWQHWNEAPHDIISPIVVGPNSVTLMPRFVRIGSGNSGGTLVYLEDLGHARQEAQNLKLAALGRLTASIAHEIRNPLSAIQQAAQLLEEDESLPAQSSRLLSMIRSNGKRIDNIVTEVLQLNRRDRRNPETLTLTDILYPLVEDLAASEQMPEGCIQLRIAPTLSNVQINFDRGHLDQILWNLLRNAWQFSKKENGSLQVKLLAAKDMEHAYLDIVDDGPGVPDEARDRLFEPFYTTRTSGTGLGLYIARELAYANFADLSLLPQVMSEGAHFRLRLRINKPTDKSKATANRKRT